MQFSSVFKICITCLYSLIKKTLIEQLIRFFEGNITYNLVFHCTLFPTVTHCFIVSVTHSFK